MQENYIASIELWVPGTVLKHSIRIFSFLPLNHLIDKRTGFRSEVTLPSHGALRSNLTSMMPHTAGTHHQYSPHSVQESQGSPERPTPLQPP